MYSASNGARLKRSVNTNFLVCKRKTDIRRRKTEIHSAKRYVCLLSSGICHPHAQSAKRFKRAPGFPIRKSADITVVCYLPAAYRKLQRPSSPPTAKASTVCASSLDHISKITPHLSFFPLSSLRPSLSQSWTLCPLLPSFNPRLDSEKKSCVSHRADSSRLATVNPISFGICTQRNILTLKSD